MNREKGRRNRESVGMAKDFNLQMLVNYVILKLTIQVSCTTTTANFK